MIKKELCKEILEKLIELKEKDPSKIVYIEELLKDV